MNVSTLLKVVLYVWIFFVDVKAENRRKKCHKVDLTPIESWFYNFNFVEYESRFEMREGEIKYHIFDATGKVLVASNANTSHVCIDDSGECHYWFIHGHGQFLISNEEGEVWKGGEVQYDNPELFPIGDCPHYCGDQQQLTFVGLKDDEPMLYVKNNKLADTLFRTVENDENSTNNKSDNNEVIMETVCMEPTECYNLVGSSRYIISSSHKRVEDGEGSTTEEEEQSTFHGSKTFGGERKCRSKCDATPLLGNTRRGLEILQVASSVSASDTLIDLESPQYRAACWLIYDDIMQLQADDYNVLQRYILAVLFYTLGGDQWKSGLDFLSPKHECDWRKMIYHVDYDDYSTVDDDGDGVHCNGLGHVSGLILLSNNLVGTIPFELASLVDIQYLDFSDNSMYGSIPSALGILLHLRLINFQRNGLTESIPESLGEIKTLNQMALQDNLLTGTIPPLNQEHYFNFAVANNMLTGVIPERIMQWASLVRLELQGNQLSGTIPEGISNLTSLESMLLEENNLVGTLPSKLFQLPGLKVLWLSENSLTGSIPSNVSFDSPLYVLYLQHNQLTGKIPTELSRLNLQYVFVNNNRLSGEVPSNFANLQNLVTFHFQQNNITGHSPFQDCLESPKFMEADCDTPQKVTCRCCTGCHGIFAFHDYGLVCTSGELTLVFEELNPGDPVAFEILNSARKAIDWGFIAADSTTYTQTSCVSMSDCFRIGIGHYAVNRDAKVKVFINGNYILEESIIEDPNLHFGFSSDGTIQKDTCDDFALCHVTFPVNSTKRGLVDRLTRTTGIQVFDDTSSSYYLSACKWVNFLEGIDDEDEFKYTKLLQYFYLALLFYETNGNEWTASSMWVTNTTICSWYGIECDSYAIVTSVRLPSNNLRGRLPTEIGELRGLKHLFLDDNRMTGTLPVEIGVKTTMLKHFNVSHNGVWGSIPVEFSQLENLVEFDASHNQLTGTLPGDVGNLKKLQVLNLFNNTCAGSLPETFYDLQSLKILSLGNNLFAGSAGGVQLLSNLESLDLSQNFFTGNVPLGSQKVLRFFKVSGNQFRGSIPISIDQLESLETLFLYDNLLTGNLPSQIGNLQNLVRVSMSHNGIKGLLPSEIGKLKNLTLLHLQDSQLEGNGDFFDYIIDDYITDCGHTFTGPARVECTNCTSCCNVEGDCIKRDITWPQHRLQGLRIKPERFVFVMTLLACLILLIPLYAFAKHDGEVVVDFQFCQEFQVASVYKFWLTNNITANAFAFGTLSIQLMLLSIFLEASDFTADKNDWEYSMSCPNDSTDCEDNRLITAWAWFAYSCVLFSYLAKDFSEGIKMIGKSFLLKSCKCWFAGFVLLYVTVCSGVTSCLYIYSTGISSTDILKDAVILLFLNEIDDRLYSFAIVVCPVWIKQQNRSINKLWDEKSIKLSANAAGLFHASCNNQEANVYDNDEIEQDMEALNGDSEQTNPGLVTAEDMNFDAKGMRALVRLVMRQSTIIDDLQNNLTELQHSHTELQHAHTDLQHAHIELKRRIGGEDVL